MRYRTSAFVIVLMTSALALPLATHAGIPFFGPIIPDTINRCAAGWGSVLTVVNNIITFLLTLAIVFVAPITIAYAGFLFVVNPVNPGGKEQAKSILLHTVIGIVVALAGWIIIDALMAVLYHPTDPGLAGKTWSQLITSGGLDECLIQEALLKNLNQSTTSPSITGISAGGIITTSSGFRYDPDPSLQTGDESEALKALLTCIGPQLTMSARITSISDSKITSGQSDFKKCATQGGCSHAANSCHYGGAGRCNGKSYAVDIGNDGNMAELTLAAQLCRANTLNESDHLHVSVGMQNGCSCDSGLAD